MAKEALINRGVEEVLKDGASFLVQTAAGRQSFSPTSFLTKFGGLDLVVTRWFNHE